MRKIITILLLLIVIGAASAAWYPRSADYNTSGDVNAANGAFSGNISVTGILTAGSTVNNGVIDGDVRLAANHSFYSTTGSGEIDWSNATGAFKTPVGTNTFGGNVVISGSKTFTTGTGASTLNGDTTVATNKALAVTTADKLTVGGVIVPQEMAIPFSYTASSVDVGVFSAKGAWNITGVELVPRVAGDNANAVNVTVKVCDSGEAPASGDAALSAVLDLKGTADTTQSGTLGANVAVSATQYIALDFSGTLTNAVGMGTIWVKRV